MKRLHLLIVDDDELDRKTIRRALEKTGCECDMTMATHSAEALALLGDEHDFDCILLDYNLPGVDGLHLLTELQTALKRPVPIIMLTGEGSELVAVEAMKRGACDYLPKLSLAPTTLYRAVHKSVEDASLRRQLAEAHAQLEHQALYDALTGLGNRRLFTRDFARSLADGERNDHPFALLLLDLDRFKALNDTWGHAAGDAVLAEIGQRLAKVGRPNDLFYRLGGDEFVALIAASDPPTLEPLLRRMLSTIEAPVLFEGQALSVGASMGIAFYPGDGPSDKALLNAADSAMYRAKRAGRGFAFAEAPPA